MLVQVLRNELGDFNEASHCCLSANIHLFEGGKVILDLLFGFAEDNRVFDHQILDHLIREIKFVAKYFFQSYEAAIIFLMLLLEEKECRLL